MELSHARFQEEREEKQQKLDLQKREVHMREFQMNLITAEEYHALIMPADFSRQSSSSQSALDEYHVGGSDVIVGAGWEH